MTLGQLIVKWVISGRITSSSTKKDRSRSVTYILGHVKLPTTTKVSLIRNSPISHQNKFKAPNKER